MLKTQVYVWGLVLKEKPHLSTASARKLRPCELELKEAFHVYAEAQLHHQPPAMQPVQGEHRRTSGMY